MKTFSRSLVFGLAAALAASLTAAPQAAQEPAVDIQITVNQIIAPVTVTDSNGSQVNGLQPRQFRLLDNGKEQDIKVDVTFNPISMVIAVQANSNVEAVLPRVQKIGSLIEPLVVGERGEVAVMAFDHRLQVLQDFTSDPQKVETAMKKIKPGSSTSRMIDAVEQASRMLRSRNPDHRRVIVLISETRDKGSEGRLREALLSVQLNNVMVYPVNISRLYTTLTGKAQPPRPDVRPPSATALPLGVIPTPSNVAAMTGLQGGSANFIPLFVEIFRQAKAIFVDNPAEVFSKGTGSTEFPFTTQRGLESAIARIGEEVRSQYLVSYSPNNKLEGGFHEIQVIVNRPDVKVRTRPGYWLAAVR